MTVKQIVISGGFHNRPPITMRLRNDCMSIAQYRRLIRHMCPVDGCICGLRDWDTQGIECAKLMDMLTTAMVDYFTTPHRRFAK